LAIIGFLGFWLVGWTVGIIFALSAVFSDKTDFGGEDAFLLVWLAFAIIGWIFGVWILATIVRGIRAVQSQLDEGQSGPP
jgi:hypothetical protein